MLDFITSEMLADDICDVTLTATARSAVSVNDKHREVQRLGRTAKEIAAEIGEELIAVKQNLAHGRFKSWVAANCSFSYAAANKYMKVARAKVDDHQYFATCNSMDEVLGIKPKPELAPVHRAATLDDLRRVEHLRAKRDDPATTAAEREAIQRKLDSIQAEVGDIEPQPKAKPQPKQPTGQSPRHAVRLKACAVMDRVAPTLTGNPRMMIISALIIAYGDTPEKIEELLDSLKRTK